MTRLSSSRGASFSHLPRGVLKALAEAAGEAAGKAAGEVADKAEDERVGFLAAGGGGSAFETSDVIPVVFNTGAQTSILYL